MHILYLPRWYPSSLSSQNGNFIRKNAIIAARNKEFKISLIHVIAVPGLKKTKRQSIQNENFNECLIEYPKSAFRAINFIRYCFFIVLAYRELNSPAFPVTALHLVVAKRQVIPALYLKFRYGLKLYITEHWSAYISGDFLKLNAIKKFLISSAYHQADKISAVSDQLASALQEQFEREVEIIPNPISPPEIRLKNKKSNQINFINVADHRENIKGISGIIRAFSLLAKENNNVQLTLVGDGPDHELYRKLAIELKLGNKVRFTGELPHQACMKELEDANICVLNSSFETFGMIALEAVALEKAVVSPNYGGAFSEIPTSALFESKKSDIESLTEQMNKALNSYNDLNLEEAARSTRNKFSEDRIQKRMLSFFSL